MAAPAVRVLAEQGRATGTDAIFLTIRCRRSHTVTLSPHVTPCW